jgi:hypothetical protein
MLCLYFIKPPETDRWIFGDRYVRKFIRRIVRGKDRPGGVEKVFINLCNGLDLINKPYSINLPFNQLSPTDKVAILGVGSHCLDGYTQPNKIVAGIGLMTHPSEWKDLCTQFPVVKYLQHSDWANEVYKPYFGDRCHTWAVGIETNKWKPDTLVQKKYDFLIYNKIRWEHQKMDETLRLPIIEHLKSINATFTEIVYGKYQSDDFKSLLNQSKAVIFLCEHESQGIACCEALAMNIPVFAWENGFCLDPNRFKWGQQEIPATSVPFFDETCGMKFKDFEEFEQKIELFTNKVNRNEFSPQKYILNNLTLEKSAQRFLEIMNDIN